MNTDRIVKQILLHATRQRVWRALTDTAEFGAWFGVKFDVPFAPGAHMRGRIVGTTVDPAVAEKQMHYTGVPFEITVETMDPERLFSFRWHPSAIEPGVDYSGEPTTLVAFALEERTDGILLTVTESGFDQIPLERRAKAFTSNEQGWVIMIRMIGEYLAHTP